MTRAAERVCLVVAVLLAALSIHVARANVADAGSVYCGKGSRTYWNKIVTYEGKSFTRPGWRRETVRSINIFKPLTRYICNPRTGAWRRA